MGHPGRVADEQHRGGQPGGQHPGVVPGPGGQHRRLDAAGGQRRRQPVAQRGVELDRGGERLLARADVDPVRLGRPAAAVRIWSTVPSSGPGPGRPGVQPGAHRRADRVGRARLGGHLADRGQRAVSAAARARPAPWPRRGASDRAGRPARWCRRGRPARRSRAATGRAARSPRPPRGRRPGRERAALLDVQLHVAPMRASRSSSGPRPRVLPGGGHRLGQRDAVAVAQLPGPLRLDRAGQQAAAQAGDAEPAPSSSLNAATAIGRAGVKPWARSWSIAANADTTPSGPSKAPPSGTESRWLPGGHGGPAPRTPG